VDVGRGVRVAVPTEVGVRVGGRVAVAVKVRVGAAGAEVRVGVGSAASPMEQAVMNKPTALAVRDRRKRFIDIIVVGVTGASYATGVHPPGRPRVVGFGC
jgi:hypothetical protein